MKYTKTLAHIRGRLVESQSQILLFPALASQASEKRAFIFMHEGMRSSIPEICNACDHDLFSPRH